MLSEQLVKFSSLLKQKAEKISANDPAYQLGVNILPKTIKELIQKNIYSQSWAFEGSVGKGSWSRTPWIAIYDERVTTRASDGFYTACIIDESYDSVFLTLMNASSNHINYKPFRLDINRAGQLKGFNVGSVNKGLISDSGRGTGPAFEASTLLWKQFRISPEGLVSFEIDLLNITKHYSEITKNIYTELPKEKPFKTNPFLIR